MRTLLLAILLLYTATTALAGDNTPMDAPAQDTSADALDAVCITAAVCVGLLSPEAPGQFCPAGSVYVWQQPGAAMVISGVWQPQRPRPQIYADPARIHDLLAQLPEHKWEAPLVYPSEAETTEQFGSIDEFYLEPAVYFLTAGEATARLARHYSGYEMWMGYNEGQDFIVPETDELAVDFAVVYLDSTGPIGLYFKRGAGGLELKHIITLVFFSA